MKKNQKRSLLEQQEKNVYQMKTRIEKNMVQRHHNMVQKHLDQEEIEDIEDIDEMESYNEISLQVGSECLVRETAAESAPIFQKSNRFNDISLTIKKNLQSNYVQDCKDELPEILKQLRNGNLVLSIQRLKSILQNENLSVSERIKYKNQINYLKFKFKKQRFELKALIAQDVLLWFQKFNFIIVLNEYQLCNVSNEMKIRHLKELQQFIIDQNKHEISQALQIIQKRKITCSSFDLNRDLKISNISQINDLRLRLSIQQNQ